MRKLYMIGNTHFDPVWEWKWDEAMASIRATFRSALDRMKETADFNYSFATPPVFEWIKETDPQMFEEIKQRVKEGRWELAEGWWVQPDCYSASGESYVRHGLYGQKWLLENFGRVSDSVFNIDSFGHSPQLPQILLKSGIKYYTFARPEERHIALEHQLFLWQGIDGSRIPTYRAVGIYEKKVSDSIEAQAEKERDALIVYGVTDHGGAPTKELISEIKSTENAIFSTVSEFFENHTDIDTIVSRELLSGDFGTYSNYPEIKKLNRIAEFALQNAELASLISGHYDRKALEACWHDVLFNQFHDILGGASIKDAYFDAEALYGRAIMTANEILHYQLQSVTKNIKTVGKNPNDIWNLALWNLNAREYNGFIEAEVQWAHEFEWYNKGIELQDENGTVYPCQVIKEKSAIPGFRSRFVFKANIPSAGYQMLKVVKTGAREYHKDINCYEFETSMLKIKFSEETGLLERIVNKKTSETVSGKILTPVCYYDDGDAWCFNITEYSQEKNLFKCLNLKVLEAGKLRTAIKGTYKFRDTKLEMYYTFYEQEQYFDVAYRVNWNEKHYVFKLETSVYDNAHTASVPYGSINRNMTKADVPMNSWVKCGNLTFASDSIFSYNMIDKTLGLTVLRSPIYGDLRIEEIDYDDEYDILSQGINEGKIRIYLNDIEVSEVQNFLNPPVVVCESNHDGELPCRDSFYEIESDSVMLSAIKMCEYDDNIILRLFEHNGKNAKAIIRIGNFSEELSLGGFEIKTLKFEDGKLSEVKMTEDAF